MAILLNLLFNHLRAGNSDQQSVFVAATERTLRYRDISGLNDGDFFRDGKLFDCDGNEVPIVETDENHEPASAPRKKRLEQAH
jgi:hypothetical protein